MPAPSEPACAQAANSYRRAQLGGSKRDFVNSSPIEILGKSIRILHFNRRNILSLGSRKKVVGAMGYRSAGVKEEVSIGCCHIWIFEQDSKKGAK